MSNRIKLTGATIKTRAELDEAMRLVREKTIDRNAAIAAREAALQTVDEAHSPQINNLASELLQLAERIEAWARENPEEFDGKRSLETVHGTLGWRTGQWQADKLTGWIWQAGPRTKKGARVVLGKLKELFGTAYVRKKEEVDKDALIADRAKLTTETLAKAGVRLFQEEAFFVDPKVEEPTTRLQP